MSNTSRIKRGRDLQGLASVIHHGTPQPREIFGWLLAERVILRPELSDPAVDVSRRIAGVEVVEVVLGEGLLIALPHQVGHPGDEDVAKGVGINSIDLGFVLDGVGLVGNAGLEVDDIEILADGLEITLGVGRVDGLDGSSGARREAVLSGGSRRITWDDRNIKFGSRIKE
jgi:hypothetical protein